MLDYIGVYSRVAARGFNYENLSFVNDHLQTFGAFWNGSEKAYNFKALRIKRHFLREALLAKCHEQAVEIKYGMKCTGIQRETETDVTVAFRNGEKVTADFVIGADGIHSYIRDVITPDCKPVFSGMMGIGGTINKRDISSHINQIPLPCFLFAQQGVFAMMPTNPEGDNIGFFVTTFQDDRPREEWNRLSADKDELSRMLQDYCHGDWPDMVKGIAAETAPEALTAWPHFEVPTLSSYVSPKHHRVILVGDAAHAIPPTGGQGAAMALEDAQTLSYALARCVTPGVGLPHADLLSRWEAQRLARMRDVDAFTRRGGASRKDSGSWIRTKVKEWGLWAMFSWAGPTGGLQWLYNYRAEDVVGAMMNV